MDETKSPASSEDYPELGMYDTEHRLNLYQDGYDPHDITVYRVEFEVSGESFCCRLHGCDSYDEALGVFFRDHPNICYRMLKLDEKE